MRRSEGIPMTGRWLIRDAIVRRTRRSGGARALSLIFYGFGPAIGPTAAIRPHLTGDRRCPVQALPRASSALNRPIGRFAGHNAAGICWPARRLAGVE